MTDAYPKYLCVNFDTFIKLDLNGDQVTATNHLGNPYPLNVAIAEGAPSTESEFLGAVGAAKKKRS